MSLTSYIRRTEGGRILLKEVKKFRSDFQTKTGDLPTDVELNVDLLLSEIQQFVDGMIYKSYVWPLSMMEGPQAQFPRLLSWMKKRSVVDINKIINRMRLFPQQIDETITLLKEGIRLGLTMHKVSVETLPKVFKDIAMETTKESSIFKPFIEKPKGIPDDKWENLVRDAKKVIESEVKPSYIKLSNFISDEYLNHTRPSVGASSLPNGEQYYAACLKFHTTTNLTPKEVHGIGMKEVTRITKRMINVKDKVKFKGSLKDFRRYLRTDVRFKFKNAAEILTLYRNVSKEIEKKLLGYFQVLPKAPYKVIPVPPKMAPTYPEGNYMAPPEDGSRPGIFYINTYKPESRTKYGVVSLSLHEALPGHHLQLSLAIESASSPDFRRFLQDNKYYEAPGRFPMYTGYIEGWGLYSEYLGEEMGMYTDPFDLFGRLSDEMFRACRLVVDTGMHALGWSRERAMKYMEENTASGIGVIKSEINRYITLPGQACSYKIGELKIKELRRKAEKKLGNKFNLRMFHQTVVSMGGVPLNILEKQIDHFIKEQLKL
jgi:uncharacterized protein (DUF885 family)